MAEELLEKIPPEKRWAITAKILSLFFVIRGEKFTAPLLGKEDGFISPVRGAEKWDEITDKIIGDASRKMMPMVKEMFNIPVEDAIGAANLLHVHIALAWGPELKGRIVEATPERVVCRWTQCPWWNRFEEFDVPSTLRPCIAGHEGSMKEGLKVINPKIVYKLTKTMIRGDPYCEDVIEFKDE